MDKDNVYYITEKIEGADPKSFQIFHHSLAKDNNAVYWAGEKLQGTDAKSFEYLGGPYSRDKNNIYNIEKDLDSYSNIVSLYFSIVYFAVSLARV